MRGGKIAIIIVLVILVLLGLAVLTWFFVIKPREEVKKCTESSQCPKGTFCSADKICLDFGKCFLSSDCIGGQVCDDGVCVECQTSKDCLGVPGKPVCDDGKCVGCIKNSQCHSGVCDTSVKRCVGCTKDSQCSSGHCLTNRCVQCKTDKDCFVGSSCIGGTCKSSTPVTRVVQGPPKMPPQTYLGTSLKPLKTPLIDPFAPYHEYRSSW